MKNTFKLIILGFILTGFNAVSEPLDTPSSARQVPNMDSDQMKVPEPTYTTEGETQGAIRFDDRSTQSQSTMSVRQAQENLNRFGYDLKVDGKMGPQTRAAIKEFQMTTGLMTTGQLNEITVDALRAQSSETYERAPASVDSLNQPGTRPNGTHK